MHIGVYLLDGHNLNCGLDCIGTCCPRDTASAVSCVDLCRFAKQVVPRLCAKWCSCHVAAACGDDANPSQCGLGHNKP
jgi:hypothetical protein